MSDIIYIREEDLQLPGIFTYIHNHPDSHLYWSNEWTPPLYSRLAYEGLISIATITEDGSEVLLPEMQRDYAVLEWPDLNLSSRVKRLLKNESFTLRFHSDLKDVIRNIRAYHKSCWLNDSYEELLHVLPRDSLCQPVATELLDAKGVLAAGELGYRIGSVYTSLSGFFDKAGGYSGWGELQMVCLAAQLQSRGYAFWNLGHTGMAYKRSLGAVELDRASFLNKWKSARDKDLEDEEACYTREELLRLLNL